MADRELHALGAAACGVYFALAVVAPTGRLERGGHKTFAERMVADHLCPLKSDVAGIARELDRMAKAGIVRIDGDMLTVCDGHRHFKPWSEVADTSDE